MAHLILFFIFAAICVAAALNLLLQRHPIHSALSLIVVMGSLAALYLLLGAQFVAAIQVIVYAGAIMVLFVFVIMLLNAGAEERSAGSQVALYMGIPAVVGLIAMVLYILAKRNQAQEGIQLGSFVASTADLAKSLFTDYLLPFEVTSVLVLIAIMGAVVLARREP
jgi:NADH-quinone oxidoreductase subunit J